MLQGLGIRDISSLASSAFLATVDVARALASLLIPSDGISPLLHLQSLALTTGVGGGVLWSQFSLHLAH